MIECPKVSFFLFPVQHLFGDKNVSGWKYGFFLAIVFILHYLCPNINGIIINLLFSY